VAIETIEVASVRSKQAGRVFSYKLALVANDVVVTLCFAAVGIWLAGGRLIADLNGVQKTLLAGSFLIPVAFFPTFRLYSYHLIFSKRQHLLSLAKAFGLSLITIAMFIAVYRISSIQLANLFTLAVVGFAAAILLISRFFFDGIAPLLSALGMVCILVGLSDLLGGREALMSPARLGPIMTEFAAACAALTALRCFLVHRVFNVVLKRRFRRQVLIIGTNEDAERILKHIIDLDAPYWIGGTVRAAKDCRISSPVPKTQLGHIRDLEAILGENFFQEAIITDETIGKADLIHILDFLTQRGITVWFLPKLMPIIDIKLYIESLFGMPMIRLASRRYQWLFRRVKYGFDAVAALLGFIALLPVFAVAALAVRLTSAGPVFYRAKAVGRGGEPFKMYKFRSMATDCSADIHKDYVTCMIKGEITADGSGTPLKITCDPRITPLGRFLRKTSLDEIPQLINVLKGEMSLVGPRPCLEYEYEIYKDWHRRRTAVRPGMTGLWQVVGRSQVSFEDMILLDLYYVYNRSMKLDISILFETLFVLLKRKGAH
jgi:undecaprenyl-phosphate galactose phosphotransferase